MKITEIITEGPLDTAGTAVGTAAGKTAFGAGQLVGKAAAKLSGSNTNVVDRDRSVNVGKALKTGIKGGIMQWATGKGFGAENLAKDQNIELIGNIIANKQVVKAEIQELIGELSTMPLSWKVDRNAVSQALSRAEKGENLDTNDINALKSLLQDLKKV